MLLKLKIEGRDTKNGAAVVLVHDYTLHMVVYTFNQSGQGKSDSSGRIEVAKLEQAIANACAFRGGHCDMNEQFAIDLVLSLLVYAKKHSLPVVWSKN